MQHTEAAAAKTETEGGGTLRLVMQARVVQGEFGQTFAQILVVVGIDREETAEDHRHRGPKIGQRVFSRAAILRQGVANLTIRD